MELTTYGLLCALAMLVVLSAAWLTRKANSVSGDTVLRLAVIAIPMVWLCSRLVYVIGSYDYFLQDVADPKLALAFRDGGYSMMGAFGGLLLAVVIAAKLTHTPCSRLMDSVAPGLPLALVIERLAERGTGLGEGDSVAATWPAWLTIDTGYGPRNAVFIYEAIVAALLFAVLLCWALKCKRRPGDVMLLFTLLFGATQVMLESFRSDGHLEVHMGVHIQQVIAAVMVVTVVGIWAARARKQQAVPKPVTVLTAVLALVLVVLAIVAEFGADRWDSKLSAYGLMGGCLLGLVALAVFNRRMAQAKL